MGKIEYCLLTICLIVLILQPTECAKESLFASFSNTMPGNIVTSPLLTSTDRWKLVLTWSGPAIFVPFIPITEIINGVSDTLYPLADLRPQFGVGSFMV
jgi:hypothetical protein